MTTAIAEPTLSGAVLEDAQIIATAAACTAGRALLDGDGGPEARRTALIQAATATMALAGLGGHPEDHPAADSSPWPGSPPDCSVTDLRSLAAAHSARYGSWADTPEHRAEIARA